MVRVDDPFYSFLIEHEQALKTGQHSDFLLKEFCELVWQFYRMRGRKFAWRETRNPYHIVVSEIMLQQTQTSRVAEKYVSFLQKFPSFELLAQTSVAELLAEWVGLGYNRRALALQGIAQRVVAEYAGALPDDPAILETFKGLGPATAASITTFAFNIPTVFIETNIRAVYIHAFFSQATESISDRQLFPLVAATVDKQNAREWYYALMDCGVELKRLYKNPSRKSKHYTRQSKFEGSDRQIRGAIIRLLAQQKTATATDITQLGFTQDRVTKVLKRLCDEQFIFYSEGRYLFPLTHA